MPLLGFTKFFLSSCGVSQGLTEMLNRFFNPTSFPLSGSKCQSPRSVAGSFGWGLASCPRLRPGSESELGLQRCLLQSPSLRVYDSAWLGNSPKTPGTWFHRAAIHGWDLKQFRSSRLLNCFHCKMVSDFTRVALPLGWARPPLHLPSPQSSWSHTFSATALHAAVLSRGSVD